MSNLSISQPVSEESYNQRWFSHTVNGITTTGKLEAMAGAALVPFALLGFVINDTLYVAFGRKNSYSGGED